MRKHLAFIVSFVVTLVLWVIAYPYLPEEMPMQWGFDGTVNWTAPKSTSMLLNLGIILIIYPILVLSPKLDPKRKGYLYTSKAYWVIIYATLGLLIFVNMFIIFQSVGYNLRIDIVIPILVGALFIVIGNYMQTVKANWFMGIRTPWTLSSETVWRKTHRLGSKLFIISGIIFFLAPFMSPSYMAYIILIPAISAGLIPTIYSYFLFKKEQEERSHE
ncbi:immunity protein SdpI [Halolactibacillus alkaliphilus]|uniref:Immunity protein SdpI n=1 Tax=Halolactibacillus alkaliphilus TaxID=442899 RepID=A0A511X3U8_9BACI|nr:SdpI family protein [Halolactibacillus alkaliphilus]GEN57585.1 immunity protein SdpI [Halolactibacillus alkaliphilus]GGN74198.1 immunity protein SdpI [Halolactibacillus alkaliphilus]SFP00625.1 Uncharacterized membrane protein [Halolactibacillus alkaliphilus]